MRTSSDHPTRRRWRFVSTSFVLSAALTVSLVGCAGENDRFCASLAQNWKLEELRDAISRGDDAGIQAGLQRFSDLADQAPPEIADDMTTLSGALSDTVRLVTQAKGPDGQNTPVDTATLSQALGPVTESSQHVTGFADRECGLHLG